MKIMIWGTGFVAQELLETELKDVAIDAFIDNKKSEKYQSILPGEAVLRPYDLIIVATGYAKAIYEQAQQLGFDMAKFFFVYNNYYFGDMNVSYEVASKVFSPQFLDIVRNRYHVVIGMHLDETAPSLFGCIEGGGIMASGYV